MAHLNCFFYLLAGAYESSKIMYLVIVRGLGVHRGLGDLGGRAGRAGGVHHHYGGAGGRMAMADHHAQGHQ